jgi:hypothetical protein
VSLQVSTYRHQWGGVSGGVEGSESLLDRALTEVRPAHCSSNNNSNSSVSSNGGIGSSRGSPRWTRALTDVKLMVCSSSSSKDRSYSSNGSRMTVGVFALPPAEV